MTFGEREDFIQEVRAKRLELRKRVAELAGQRRQYVAQEVEAKAQLVRAPD